MNLTIKAFVVKSGDGWKSAVFIRDDSAAKFQGQPWLRRHVFPVTWVHREDAMARAEKEAAQIRETGAMTW